MQWLLGVLGVGALVALAFGAWWFSRRPRHATTLTSEARPPAGYSVWAYERGSWHLMEDRSAPDFVPGPPPVEAGPHEGYCVKVTSVRPVEGPAT